MSQLMLFRTIYLRSIAEAWANPTFHDALIKDPAHTMNNYFGFPWPWDKVCSLTVIEDKKKLQWISDEWVWSKNGTEGLALYVPLSPPSTATDSAQQSQALADWYRQRSSLFSDSWGAVYGPHGQPTVDAVHDVEVRPDVGAHSPPPHGGYMPASQDFDSFKVVLLAAIAKAWGDPLFCEKLCLDAETALREIRGYELPWDLGITICNDTKATWTAPTVASPPNQYQSYWSGETPHMLTLYLPSAPSGMTDAPVALAMYNAAGAEYPFTCCCDP